MKILRVVFCAIACLFAAAAMIAGILFGYVWFFICLAGAAIFAALMYFAKKRSEPAPPPAPDFMNSDEENEKINQELSAPEETDSAPDETDGSEDL